MVLLDEELCLCVDCAGVQGRGSSRELQCLSLGGLVASGVALGLLGTPLEKVFNGDS